MFYPTVPANANIFPWLGICVGPCRKDENMLCIVGILNAKYPVKEIVIRVCWNGYCGPRVNWHLLCSSKMT